MENQRPSHNDMTLMPNTYCHVLDGTKGSVTLHRGPTSTSLSGNDEPVIFDETLKQFRQVPLDQAIQNNKTAPEAWYVVLKNPTDNQLSGQGDLDEKGELHIGRKVNIPGPCSFPLQPGQMAKVVQGHNLKSNQYLVVRVYDAAGAKENMEKAIITIKEGEEAKELSIDPTMGKLMIIKGTDVSFYIPPTGVEVTSFGNNQYIQEAVTLERLEYCILLDESGQKRYVRGPNVVFPQPSEKFVVDKKDNTMRKYRAKELSEISGLYIKVTTDYEEGEGENKKSYKAGEELFITGKDTPLYYPREEHAIIKYDDKSIHFATAIPSGEARYVMHRINGDIELAKGPQTLLPDPRTHVLIRRVLDDKQVHQWFPGNQKALDYNQSLGQMLEGNDNYVSNTTYMSTAGGALIADSSMRGMHSNSVSSRKRLGGLASKAIGGDDFDRKHSHTEPRSVTLNTKFEGAVTIDVWTGYAVNVVQKAGKRRVVVGPKTVMLEYDEYLETTKLSSGMPKDDSNAKTEAYLRVLNNRVSDIVEVESSDLCKLNVILAYKVNFEGEENKWFDVENYVSHLCGHMRSVIKNCVKTHKIEGFYGDSISILRNLILKKPVEGGDRPGYTFKENGMRICDVEIIGVEIQDADIRHMIVNSQTESVSQFLNLRSEERKLEMTEKKHKISREIDEIQEKTSVLQQDNKIKAIKRGHEIMASSELLELTHSLDKYTKELSHQESLDKLQESNLARTSAKNTQVLEFDKAKQDLALENLKANVTAFKDRYGAIDDKFIAAVQASGNAELIKTLSESMAPAALLGGKSVVEVFRNLVKGTVLEKALDGLNPTDKE